MSTEVLQNYWNGLYWAAQVKKDPDRLAKNALQLEGDTRPKIPTTRLPVPPGAFMDCIPISEGQVLFFLAFENKLQVWEGTLDFTAHPFERGGKNMSSKTPIYSVAVPWSEAFQVFGKPPYISLVTESGHLYSWQHAGQPKQMLEQHWKAPAIEAIVTDADSEKVWAFTAPQMGKDNSKRYYFQLQANQENGLGEKSEYKLPDIKAAHLPARLRQLLPYVKVLENDKRIQIPKT